MIQQQAIERILGWILENAKKQGTISSAQKQFEEACMRMNKFGTRERNPGQSYCESRFKLDDFMSTPIMELDFPAGNSMRNRYFKHISILGNGLDGYCSTYKLTESYIFGSFQAGVSTRVTYKGPNL